MTSFSQKSRNSARATVDTLNTHGDISQTAECANCGEKGLCRRRSFSEQAWTMLLLWNEINPGAVDKGVCEQCYEEMRDSLIDRADEVEAALNQDPKQVERVRKKLSRIAV
jgi:hypothetical protein